MSGTLPPSLTKNNELTEDFRALLEQIIEQNAEIMETLETLDNALVSWAKAPVQNVKVTGSAVFWEKLFSFWGAIVVMNLLTWPGIVLLSIFSK